MDLADAARILDEELFRGIEEARAAADREALAKVHTSVLGRRSRYAEVQRALGSFAEADRRSLGRKANEVRSALEAAFADREDRLARDSGKILLAGDAVDVTLPGRKLRAGSLHPLTIIEDETVGIFTRMGYRVAQGPEIEDEWHNFEALNIPKDHPARTMKDSLYVDIPGLLLRTETSAVQIRTMESQEPPVYVVAPGCVYRREAVDATHLSVFHQVEGLAVDEGLSFAHLKGTLEAFAKAMFGPERRIRLNPDYFPFVEPGAQVAVSCFVCDGSGCRTCGNGWIELLGAGMVHPKVLEACGYDSERFTGFAFGLGVERVAMVRYGVSDLRRFIDNDVRFLERFQGLA